MKKFNITKTILVLLAIASFSLHSCEKHEHDDDANDHSVPVLILTSSIAGQTFNSGDTVWINGTLTDNSLHECYISIKNSKDSLLFEYTPAVHDLTSYDINTFWKSSATVNTNATIAVTAQDHNNNKATASATVVILP